ncbi:ACP S-malonyltransferase [Adlercreutzia muris]|uniref:ACP S-malonyltransferase n=1 Tax=Adlercreutzia muris TaxID=1796610 RepID=UPI0035164F67
MTSLLDETPLAPLGPTGLVFMASGQGSQKPGMGADLLDIPEVAATFACASDVLGRDVAALVRDAAPEELNDTRNAQIAISALSIGTGWALMARGVVPDALLGFSLGQISALVLGDMLDEGAAFALIAERSRLMGEAADENPGVMSAFLKITLAEAQELCAACAEGEVLVPANLNGGGQIVMAGTPAAVARAEEAWAASKGRFSRLATSGGFHSPLMAPAAEAFADYLAGVDFRASAVPVIGNVHGAPLEAATVREELVAHLVSPVQFEASVQKLAAAGAQMFAEVGFGGVLANLVKRIDRAAPRAAIQDRASFDAFVAENGE